MPPLSGIPTPSSREWQDRIAELVASGHQVSAAVKSTGKVYKTYEYHRKTYPDFARRIDLIRQARRKNKPVVDRVPDFAEFRRKYLGAETYPHMLQWVDLLEGREPRDLHPSMTYRPGQAELLVLNTPPEHAKSTTITIDYVVWRILQDPNIRVLVVSKTQTMAKKFLYAIKTRLTHPRYRKLWLDFGGADGFKNSSESWTADMIYVGGDIRDGDEHSGEKDPTVQALGIGGQVYGARADLIVIDDAVVRANAHDFDNHIGWIQQEVLTRITRGGRLLIVGTRMMPRDLYSEIQDPARYTDGVSPFTYFAQPAVLEFAESSADWTTLWPYADLPTGVADTPLENGLYVKWDGPSLARRRGQVEAGTWAMVYQQEQVHEDATFNLDAVKAAVNGQRIIGPLRAGALGHRREGMDGLYVIGSCDPAAVGDTGFIVMAVDRETRKRYVLEPYARAQMAPAALKGAIKSMTDKYGINEWVIEKNAFQGFLVYDEELRDFLNGKGVRIYAHHTGANKLDPDLGVASVAALFDGWDHTPSGQLIELPSPKQGEGPRLLIEQLVTWVPGQDKKIKADLVMALWFAELRAREILAPTNFRYHVTNPYATPRELEGRVVINIEDYLAEQHRIAV